MASIDRNSHPRGKRARHAVLVTALCALAATSVPAMADPMKFEIAAGEAADALAQFGRQSGLQMFFARKVIDGHRTQAVLGEYEPADALSLLLEGTGLAFEFINERTVTVVSAQSASRLRVAQLDSRQASTAVAPSDTTAAMTVEEVVVTAQKRSERLVDVAASVSALSSLEMERKGLVGGADYLRTLPSVSQIEVGAGNNSIIMRGVSSSPQTFDRGAKATVGYYLNDVPLAGYTYRGGADVKLVDLERIEVVRGPQGTLYGSGSLGGVVRNIPNAPNLARFEGSVKAEYSATERAADGNSAAEGVLNVPLVEGKLAARIVGYWFDNSGYVENIAGSDPATLARAARHGVPELARNEDAVGSDEYVGGRVALLFQPVDSFKATLTYMRQDISQDGLPDTEPSRAGKYQQSRLQLSEIVGGGGESLQDDLEIASLAMEYDLGWGSLLSSSAWVREEYLEKRDIGGFFGGAPIPQRNPGTTDGFIEELRFTSAFNGPFQVLAGLYYEDIDRSFLARNYYGGRVPALNPFGQTVITDELRDEVIEQQAIFGELSYEWQKLKLTLGARHFSYDDEIKFTRGASASSVPGVATLKGDNEGTTYKANVAYHPTRDALVYAQWSEGFRLGSPVSAANPRCDLDNNGVVDGTGIASGPRTLDPDYIDSYELGTKLTLLGGSLIVTTAAYRNNWTGVPLLIPVSCGFGVEANAGEAKTEGVEFSSELAATEDLRLTLAGSYGEAELTKDAPAINGAEGDRLPGSPRYTVTASAEYRFDLLGRNSFVRGDYTYSGGFYNNLKQTGIEAGDYGLLNLRGGITFDRLGFDLYVKNVTNSDAVTWSDVVFAGANARLYKLRPRTVGLSARYSF